MLGRACRVCFFMVMKSKARLPPIKHINFAKSLQHRREKNCLCWGKIKYQAICPWRELEGVTSGIPELTCPIKRKRVISPLARYNRERGL